MVTRLEELCLAKSVIEVCTRPDVKKQIFSHSLEPLDFICKYEKWSRSLLEFIEKKFIDFPPVLKPSLPRFLVNYAGLQMLKWAKFNNDYFDLTLEFSENFLKDSLFTSKGKIDEKKAAEELIKDPRVNIFLQYKIACYYYLSDTIPILWQMLVKIEPDFEKLLEKLKYGDPIREQHFVRMHPNQSSRGPVVLWSEYLQENQGNSSKSVCPNSSFYSFLKKSYCLGIEKGNPMAVEYAWKGLENIDWDWEKTKLKIIRHFNYADFIVPTIFTDVITLSSKEFLLSWELETFGDILKFLIEQLKDEKLRIIQSYWMSGYCVLRFLLFWPYQNLFLDTADSLFEILSEEDFYALLQTIADLIEDTDIGLTYDYRELLGQFWSKSPSHFKEHVKALELFHFIDFPYYYSSGYKFIDKFLSIKLATSSSFTAEDEHNFRLIFLGSLNDNFMTTLSDHQGKVICPKLVLRERLRLLDLYIECITDDKFHRKISFAVSLFHTLIKIESIDLIEDIIKWISVNAFEIRGIYERFSIFCSIDDFDVEYSKSEFFSQAFKCSKIADLFLLSQVSVSFLNYIVMWFLEDSKEVKRWKSKVLDADIGKVILSLNYDTVKFDKFLEWLGYFSEKEKSNIKREILTYSIPSITAILTDYYCSDCKKFKSITDIATAIADLCIYDIERVQKFIKQLNDYLLSSFLKLKMCMECRRQDKRHYRRYRTDSNNSTTRILKNKDAKLICPIIFKELEAFIQEREKELD